MLPTQPQHKVQTAQQADKHKGQGPVHSAMQATISAFASLEQAEIGIVGEHIADYYCAEHYSWAPGWTAHDKGETGTWAVTPGKTQVGKLSNKTKLFKLGTTPNGTGIDAVWRASGHNEGKTYAVVEAKSTYATKRIDGTTRLGIVGLLGVPGKKEDAAKVLDPITEEDGETSGTPKKGGGSKRKPPSGSRATPANDSPAPKAGNRSILVQMSREWIDNNIERAVDSFVYRDFVKRRNACYSRHLFYVTGEQPSFIQHGLAFEKGTTEKQETHTDHGLLDERHYDETAVKAAVDKKKERLRKRFGELPNLKNEP